MLDHNLVMTPDNLPGRTPFADFWLQAMFHANPASRAGDMGCSTYMSFMATASNCARCAKVNSGRVAPAIAGGFLPRVIYGVITYMPACPV
jgi:hypothetical protein